MREDVAVLQLKVPSGQGQAAMIWWGLGLTTVYALCLIFLLHMVPPPSATLGAEAVADFYRQHRSQILLGATICSWTGAFMVPMATVLAIQTARLQQGVRSWAILCFAGGIMMSLFLVLPPLFWGIAAFTVDRPAELTLLMHELALLTLTTTDQYFIFQMIPVAWVSLSITEHRPDSALPRWLGYSTLWIALAFEAGAWAFMTRTGPFAWNGRYVFWVPLIAFGTWILMFSVSCLRALAVQQRQGEM